MKKKQDELPSFYLLKKSVSMCCEKNLPRDNRWISSSLCGEKRERGQASQVNADNTVHLFIFKKEDNKFISMIIIDNFCHMDHNKVFITC